MKHALLTSGIAASLISLSFAAPSLQDPARTQQPNDRAQQDDLRVQDSKVEQRTMLQVADAYRSLHKASLDVLRAYASDWSANIQPNDIVSHRREATERRGEAEKGDDRRQEVRGGAPATPPTTAHPGFALQGEELLIAACTDGLLAGAPVYGAHDAAGMKKERGADTNPARGDSKARSGEDHDGARGDEEYEEYEHDSQDDQRADDAARDASDQMHMAKGERSAADVKRGGTVGLLLVCAYGDASGKAPMPAKDRRAQVGTGSGVRATETTGTATDASAPVTQPVGTERLQPGVFAVHRAGDSVWLTDEAGSVVLRTEIEHMGMQPEAREARDGSVSETEAERKRIRSQIASSSFAESAEDWELVFGAITKEAMTSMGWAKGERVSLLRR